MPTKETIQRRKFYKKYPELRIERNLQKKIKQQQLREIYLERGLCKCGGEKSLKYKTCAECRMRGRKYGRRFRNKRLKQVKSKNSNSFY